MRRGTQILAILAILAILSGCATMGQVPREQCAVVTVDNQSFYDAKVRWRDRRIGYATGLVKTRMKVCFLLDTRGYFAIDGMAHAYSLTLTTYNGYLSAGSSNVEIVIAANPNTSYVIG